MRKINVQPIQSVERTIQILNCFSFDHSELAIDEVIQKTGLSKATVYRLLWTLEKNGLVHYDTKQNVYRLGYKLLEYGGIVLENLDIRREAEPFLVDLHESTHHTILLAVRQQDTMQYLLRFDSDEGFSPVPSSDAEECCITGRSARCSWRIYPRRKRRRLSRSIPWKSTPRIRSWTKRRTSSVWKRFGSRGILSMWTKRLSDLPP